MMCYQLLVWPLTGSKIARKSQERQLRLQQESERFVLVTQSLPHAHSFTPFPLTHSHLTLTPSHSHPLFLSFLSRRSAQQTRTTNLSQLTTEELCKMSAAFEHGKVSHAHFLAADCLLALCLLPGQLQCTKVKVGFQYNRLHPHLQPR